MATTIKHVLTLELCYSPDDGGWHGEAFLYRCEHTPGNGSQPAHSHVPAHTRRYVHETVYDTKEQLRAALIARVKRVKWEYDDVTELVV